MMPARDDGALWRTIVTPGFTPSENVPHCNDGAFT
jgi:hypothetical protein